MKIRTLLAVFIAAAGLAGLSVFAVESGKEPKVSSEAGTVTEKQCSGDCACPKCLKAKGVSVEDTAQMCPIAKAKAEKEKTGLEKEVKAEATETAGSLVEPEEANLTPREIVRQGKWHTDYQKALKLARETKRPILVEFVGSDWCGWCKKLEKEVTSQKEFKEYAKENLVLFSADFPRQKEIPAEVKKQNRELAEKHKVEGFPTVLLLSPEGKVLARTGYQAGGAEKYVKHVEDLLKKAEKAQEKPST